jgi:hypothetical protein
MGMGGQLHAPPPGFTHDKQTRYQLYKKLGGPQGQSGRVRKISPQSGFDHRKDRPVSSRYTDWAIGGPCTRR